MPPSWRSPLRCRDGRSPSPHPCRPTWRRRGGNSPDRRLESGTAASLTISANRFDAIPPARRDPAAARAIDETHRDPIAPECASRRPASACAPDPPRSRRDDMPPGDAAEDYHEDMKTLDAKRVLEAALICSSQPMSLRELAALFADEIGNDTLRDLLDELAREYADKGIALVQLASGFRLQSRPEMAPYLARLSPERPPRYSRAVLETLAIIAYRQPVTRGDIEEIRGVAVASTIIKQLEDRGWIEAIGYRETPGRPALLATTRQLLDDLGLQSLDQLPTLDGTGDAPAAGHDALAALAAQSSLSFADASGGAEAADADPASELPPDPPPRPPTPPWKP